MALGQERPDLTVAMVHSSNLVKCLSCLGIMGATKDPCRLQGHSLAPDQVPLAVFTQLPLRRLAKPAGSSSLGR